MGELVKIRGQGHWDFVCTPDHPFLTHDNQWLPAKEMQGKRWCEVREIPTTEQIKPLNGYDVGSPRFVRILGSNITFGGIADDLAEWFNEEFGKEEKRIPMWLFSMPDEYIRKFLEGCFDCLNTIFFSSRSLAVGVKILLTRIGISATVLQNKKSYGVIKNNSERIKYGENHAFGIVRSVEQARAGRVYNLSVEEDETYTADGIVVHNCQPFSLASASRSRNDHGIYDI